MPPTERADDPKNSTAQLRPGMKDSVWSDVCAVLRPQPSWHYLLHLYVVLVSSAYWISALWAGGGASLAELILYRPAGDSQVYPVLRALSEGNFGNPSDALRYGEGMMSFPAPALLPHALLLAVFGEAGYIIGDAVVPWCYLVGVTLLLRQCRFGEFSSLLLGALLATGALVAAVAPCAEWFARVVESSGVRVWEPGVPNLMELIIYGQRIHRPLVTEIYVVLVLYLLLKTLRERRTPDFRRGLACGVTLMLLFQGDLYSTAAIGLLFLGVAGWLFVWHGRVVPLGFGGGAMSGALAVGWFFLIQRVFEQPDVAARWGLIDYPRFPPLFLPGYGWLIRVGVVLALAGVVWRTVRHRTAGDLPMVAAFWAALVVLAALAQPIQIALLGKQVQIYHYGHNLKVFYSYAMVILVCLWLGQWFGGAWFRAAAGSGHRWRVRVLVVGVLCAGAWLVFARDAGHHAYQGHPRGASVETEPWAAFGSEYRPALRELEREFRRDAALRAARTFTTFNQDVYDLFAAFLDKRAFTPDAAMSTLDDAEIERRLLVMGLLLGLDHERLQQWLGDYYVLNTFFAGNKYRFATDYRYSSREGDYPPELLEKLANPNYPQQDGWTLVLPISERIRMMDAYDAMADKVSPSDPTFPEVIVLCPSPIEAYVRLKPHPALYRQVFTNRAFQVFLRQRP